eukprot:541369_1
MANTSEEQSSSQSSSNAAESSREEEYNTAEHESSSRESTSSTNPDLLAPRGVTQVLHGFKLNTVLSEEYLAYLTNNGYFKIIFFHSNDNDINKSIKNNNKNDIMIYVWHY